jgi:regulator of protease activity HflC (stomatin/prohibitin superfamily)
MNTQHEMPNFDMKKGKSILILAAVALFVIFLFSKSMFVTIDATERAVIFRQLSTGLDKDHIYSPGFEVVAPWNKLNVFSVAEQTKEETMDVLDKNGLSVNIDVTVRFNPIYNKIGYLYEKFEMDYINLLVVPEIRSVVRQVAGRYTAEEIYSTKRSEVELAIITEAGKKLLQNNVDMKALLIRSIKLPKDIKQAIENKLTQEQEALAYRFKLEKEKSEAERKRIAAEGESAANKIINNSLTPQLLKMRGIEATLELSKSSNTKTIIIGSGKDGMPLILGGN